MARQRKDTEHGARGQLRASPGYTAAREALARTQAQRIAQLMAKDARELIEVQEVRSVFVHTGQSLRMRLLGIERRMRSAFPTLDPKAFAFLRDAHTDALKLLAGDVLKLGDE